MDTIIASIERARAAIDRNEAALGNNPEDCDWEKAVAHLLTDLLHLCAEEEIEWQDALAQAERTYAEELLAP